MADIFLSHSSVDNDAADRIRSWLERDRKSWSVFLDKHSRDGILAGQGWQDRLRRELQSCRLVVAIITKDWLASRWCFTEAVTATFRGKDFVGVVPGPLPDGALEVAPPIVHERQRQPLDLTSGDGWKELLHALDRSGLDPNQWFAIPEGVRPYPGFVAFEEKDAGVFFGRDQEITQYLDELNLLKAPDRAQALVISGGSGSGKSSLLKAGLIPRLRRQPDWLIVPPFDPSREPIHALFAALRTAAQGVGAEIDLPQKPPQTVDEQIELLNDSLRAIEEKAYAWLLLPLDQAEILVAGSQSEGETDAFRLLAAVGRLLAGRARKLVAVLTIRTEFMPALERGLPPAVRLHDRSLRPLTALSEVIEKPAARFGIELEEGLTGRMVEDTRGADAVPLLAYTLRELNETYGDDKLLRVADYEQLGGVEGAIEKKLHEALSDPEPTAQELAAFRRCFVRQLVRVDERAIEGERYLRTAVLRDALPEEAIRLVDRLREARLLVGGDAGTIGIAHDRLIRNWSDAPLQTWLADDSGDRKLIDTLKSFLAAHRDGGPLLSEKPLLDAKDFLKRDRSLKDDEPELAQFIEDSVAAEQASLRRRKWQLRRARAAAVVFIAVAAVAGWFYLKAEEARTAAEDSFREATTLRLLAEGEAMTSAERPGGSVRGLLQVLAASRMVPSAGADGALQAEFLKFQRQIAIRESRLPIDSLAFSPDGRSIVAGSHDGHIQLWDVRTAEPVGDAWLGHGPISSIAFGPEANRIVSASPDGQLQQWNLDTRQLLPADPSMPAPWFNWSVAISRDGRRFAWGREMGDVVLWNLAESKLIGQLPDTTGSVGPPLGLSFSSDGNRVAYYSNTGAVGVLDSLARSPGANALVWRADAGSESQGFTPMMNFGVRSGVVAFSPDGTRLVSGSTAGNLQWWDAASGRPLSGRIDAHYGGVTTLAFSPDGKQVISGGNDYSLKIWSSDTLTMINRGDVAHTGPITAVAFGPDGQRFASAGLDGTFRLWDLRDAKPHGREVRADLDEVTSVVFGSDDEPLVTGALVRNMGDRRSDIFARSPDGSRQVVRVGQNELSLNNTQTGETIAQLFNDKGPVQDVVFSPDGALLASIGNEELVLLWDARTGRPLASLRTEQRGAASVAISMDGKLIATGGFDSTIRIWSAAAGTPVQSIAAHDGAVRGVAFSRDGKRIVSASEDRTLKIWDVATGKLLIGPLIGHEAGVRSVAFSPDDSRIVSGGGIPYSVQNEQARLDYSLRLWDAATGRPIGRPLVGHQHDVQSVAFSRDGKRVVSASLDNSIRVWNVFDAWADALCAKLPRNPTLSEWREWVSPSIDYVCPCPGLGTEPACARANANQSQRR